MTTLVKDVKYTWVPGNPGSPGTPGTPATPGYFSYDVTYPGTWVLASTVVGGNLSVGGQQVSPTWIFVAGAPVTTYTYHPGTNGTPPTAGTPYTPSQTLTDFNLGWNAKARSITSLMGDGVVSFTIPNDVGVVVGYTNQNVPDGYSDISHGIYSSHLIAKVFEFGVQVASLGAHTASDVFKIRRQMGTVSYLLNGTVMYSSADGAGRKDLVAALYSGGDAVVGTTMTDETNVPNVLPPLSAFGGVTAAKTNIAVGSLLALTATAFVYPNGCTNSFMALDAYAADAATGYQLAVESMSPLTATSSGFTTPAFGVAKGIMDFPISSAHCFTGQLGTSTGNAFMPLSAFASQGASSSSYSVMPAMVSLGYTLMPPDMLTVFSGGVAADQLTSQVNAYLVMNSSGTVTGLFTVQTLQDGDVSSAATALSTLTSTQIINAIMLAQAQAGSLNFENPDVQVWAMNVKNNGTTRYSSYSFNSFAKIGSAHYATRADGVYKLSGANDSGTAIAASVNFGKMDFGTSRLKSITQCYVGVASTGAIVLKIVADGLTYYYTARDNSAMLGTQRVDLGRGFRTNFFELELQNSAGGAFELATIEFTPIPLSRRI